MGERDLLPMSACYSLVSVLLIGFPFKAPKKSLPSRNALLSSSLWNYGYLSPEFPPRSGNVPPLEFVETPLTAL